MSKTPTTLIIMDGFGVWDDGLATPSPRPARRTWTRFCGKPRLPPVRLQLDVGLPRARWATPRWGTPTSAPAGGVPGFAPHQPCAIEDGSFFENAAYIEAMDDRKERDGALT